MLMSQPDYLNNLHMMSLLDELKVHQISLLHYLTIIKVNHKAGNAQTGAVPTSHFLLGAPVNGVLNAPAWTRAFGLGGCV